MPTLSPFEFGVGAYIWKKLPRNYIVGPDDLDWLLEINKFFGDLKANGVNDWTYKDKSINYKKLHKLLIQANKLAIAESEIENCDPWELLIDAKVCDDKCKAITPK